jgi:hypothetical protein
MQGTISPALRKINSIYLPFVYNAVLASVIYIFLCINSKYFYFLIISNVLCHIYIFYPHWFVYAVTIVLSCLYFLKYNSRLNNSTNVKTCVYNVLNNHISIPYLNFTCLPNFTHALFIFIFSDSAAQRGL